jgi:alpha-amylase
VAPCGDGVCSADETCRSCEEDCQACPPPVCGDGVCDDGEMTLTCELDCPFSAELPGCERFNLESCKDGSQFHANDDVAKRRWQTPKPGSPNYQASYQDYHVLVGYTDIRYASPALTEADVCIIAKHRFSVELAYFFNGVEHSSNCKRFDASLKDDLVGSVVASDGAKLTIPPVGLAWNRKTIASRPGDYRNGQKGGVAEFFGWPHKDVEKECELLSKAGYLGAKLFPVHEQLMSYQPFEGAMNPWYFMYQPVSYKLDGRMGTREELVSLINTCRSKGVRIYVDVVLNHFTGAGNDMQEHRNPNGIFK